MIKIPLVIPEGEYQGTPVNLKAYLAANRFAGWKDQMAFTRFFCPANVDGLTSVRIEFGSAEEGPFVPEKENQDGTLEIVSDIIVENGGIQRLNPADWSWFDGWVRVVVTDTEYEAPVGGLAFEIGARKV